MNEAAYNLSGQKPRVNSHYMESFKEYLEKNVNLSRQIWHDLQGISAVNKHQKKEFIVKEGETFNKEIFISQGIIRAYKTGVDGNELTTAFYQKNDFMNISSLRNQEHRSISTYQALTISAIIVVDADDFKKLINVYPELMKLAKLVKEREVERLKIRDNCIMQVSGADKYVEFRTKYPDIEEKIPHYYIASYLGISPVTLSRIRKKLKN